MPAGQTAEAEFSIYVLIRRRFLALDFFISLRGSSMQEDPKLVPNPLIEEEEEESGKKRFDF